MLLGVVSLGLSILALALGVANIQLIQADADYRLAQQEETGAGQLVGQSGQLQQIVLNYDAAVASYHDALNTVPSWIDLSPQDTYYLFLGKTLLEYADALRKDTSGERHYFAGYQCAATGVAGFSGCRACESAQPRSSQEHRKALQFLGFDRISVTGCVQIGPGRPVFCARFGIGASQFGYS